MEILNDEDREYSEKHTAKIFFEDFLDLVKVYTDTPHASSTAPRPGGSPTCITTTTTKENTP